MDFKVNKYYLESNQRIQSLDEFIKITEFVGNNLFNYIWFRGQSSITHNLCPTFLRLSNNKNKENSIIENFISRSKSIISGNINSLWDYYQIMQHYGCPTRLLDWTESSLVALYFAVKNSEDISSVWLLDPSILNLLSNNENGVYYVDKVFEEDDLALINTYLSSKLESIPKFPIALRPKWIDNRMMNQQSCFTMHGFNKSDFEELHIKFKTIFLCKINIAEKANKTILSELERLGINEYVLFPNLEGLSRFIKYAYFE